jgi:hypothetical protein
MGDTLKNIKIPYPTEGVIRSAQLNDTITPENSVQLAVNMNFDRVGAMITRNGIATYASTLAGSITSFGSLNSQSSSTKYLFAQVGTDIRALNSTTNNWASVRTCTVTTKARFSQFLNRTWMVNGSSGDVPKTSNGGAFDTTDVPATFPKADFIEAGYDGRVWVADSSKDILYYTDIVQSVDGTTYVSPLTFDITKNFITKFSPQDGESITGLFRVPKALLLFKQNHIYRVYNTTNVDPYPAYNVGTFSQESIIQAKDGVYFHHSSGFYKFTYDSQPTEISRRVIDFVKAIPRTSYANIIGIYDGFDAVKWSIGSVTVDGVTYANCQMRYSISTQVWTVYDYAGINITALIKYDNGTSIEQVAGTSTGLVGKLDSGYTDFTNSIYYEMIDRWRCFTEMYSMSKSVSGVMVMTENGAGMELQYRTEKTPEDKWENVDSVKDKFDALFPNASTEDFNNIQFRLRGYNSGTPIIYHGTELLSIQIKGLEQN